MSLTVTAEEVAGGEAVGGTVGDSPGGLCAAGASGREGEREARGRCWRRFLLTFSAAMGGGPWEGERGRAPELLRSRAVEVPGGASVTGGTEELPVEPGCPALGSLAWLRPTSAGRGALCGGGHLLPEEEAPWDPALEKALRFCQA